MGNTKQQGGREVSRMVNWNMKDEQIQSQKEEGEVLDRLGKIFVNKQDDDKHLQKNDSQPEEMSSIQC